VSVATADARQSGWVASPSSIGFRERWPASRGRRWLLRLALATPYAILAIVAYRRDIVSEPNLRLERAAGTIDWGSTDLGFIENIYPPIPVAIANVLPDDVWWLGLVGAVCAGVVLQVLWERLHQRQVRTWLIVLLLASVGLTPAFLYSSTQDLVAFLGMALFTLAIAGMLRFAVESDTEGGFQCGIAFGVAAMCDPATFVYALLAGIAAPLLASRRYREEPGAATATLAVILVPTVAAFAGWTFLVWRFTGELFSPMQDDPAFLDFPGGFWATLRHETWLRLQSVVIMPVFLLTVIAVGRRRPLAIGAHALVLLAVLITQVVGIHLGSGQGLVIIACIGVMTVATNPGTKMQAGLAVAAVAQVVLNWRLTPPDSMISRFVDQLF
jgi:hypothetical protein